jgi:hypothetical protein
MKIYAIRIAAFVVGSLIAGCVYATHDSSPAKGGTIDGKALAVYPSATMTSGNPDGDHADVDVRMPMVRLHFIASRYDSADPPAKVEAFYRKALSSLGPVSEKSGGPHTTIQGFVWRQGPGQRTLASGKTIVAVEPREAGSEFAVITIDAGKP